MTFIQHEDLIEGGVYIVHARNFHIAAYDGTAGFIGLREQGDNRYLDWEACRNGPYGREGTASAMVLVDTLSDDIVLDDVLRNEEDDSVAPLRFKENTPLLDALIAVSESLREAREE